MKANRVDKQPAYIIHRRPYGDTSFIIDFFTRDYGRVSAVAKGVRKTSGKRGDVLQPFGGLSIGWSGKTDLKTLIHYERESSLQVFHGEKLYCGLYINELLTYLLHPYDSHQELYQHYENVLLALMAEEDLEPILRDFEWHLLREIGYELYLVEDYKTGAPVDPEADYYFDAENGVSQVLGSIPKQMLGSVFQGKELLAIQERQWHLAEVRSAAKRLIRLALIQPLAGKELRSRQLFN